MTPASYRLAVPTLMLLVATIAAHAQPVTPQTQGKPSRVIDKGEWQVLRRIGLDSDLLGQPIGIAVSGDRILVLDVGDNSIKSISIDGVVQWKAGRKGRGPGEFTTPVTLAVDAGGSAIIYDPSNARVTVFDSNGKLKRVVDLGRRTDRVVPGSRTDKYLLLNTASDSLSMDADTLGMLRVVARMPADLRPFAGIAREMSGVIPTPLGYQVAFRWSSRMLAIDRAGTILRSCTAIDSLSFPSIRDTRLTVGGMKVRSRRVEPRAKEASLAIAPVGTYAGVLRSTAAPDTQLLDLYTADCGRYVKSRPFPFISRHLASNQAATVAIVTEPVPHLIVLRWVPR